VVEQRLDRLEHSVETLIFMAGVNMTLLVIGVTLGAAILFVNVSQRLAMKKLVIGAHDLLLQCVQYFQMVKELTNISRLAQQRVEQAAPAITQGIEEMPDRTANKVVDKLKSGDSGVVRP
jgi:hypothetical protein